MGCCDKIRNITVLVFNVIFFILGVTVVVLGALSSSKLDDISKVIPPAYNYLDATPTVLLVLGSIVIVVSIFGTIGVLKWNLFLLNCYTIILVLIFLLHIILGISTFWAVTNQSDLAVAVNTTVADIFANRTQNEDVIDLVQSNLHCCGTNGSKFWKQDIPESCYSLNDGTLYNRGCQNTCFNFLLWTIRYTGTTLLALAPLLVVGAVLSQCLNNSIRNYDRVYGKYNR